MHNHYMAEFLARMELRERLQFAEQQRLQREATAGQTGLW